VSRFGSFDFGHLLFLTDRFTRVSLNGLNSGLPHAHILVILDPADKPDTPAAVDRLVCAELPDPVAQPALWSIITKNNMHLCRQPAQGVAACCDASGVCTKRFPRDFNADTALGDDEYAQYRRRNNGRTYEKFYRGELHCLDNRHVVPYNPSLSLRYNAHINVEICSSIKAVKYVVKYVNKGPDRAAVNLNRDGQHDVPVDEIKEYLEGRYVGSCEAAWRTFGFGLGAHSHTIVRLPVHLDGDDQVVFDEAADLEDVAETAGGHTKLTAFFKLCATLPPASRDITYQDVPVHYTWHALTREWRKRQRGGSKTIGRIYQASPSEGERFYLRLLLTKVKGPTSFAALRTVNNVVYGTYKEACVAAGLLEDDNEWLLCMQEAALTNMPSQLRALFASILLYCEPRDIGALWASSVVALSEDQQGDEVTKTRRVARLINALLQHHDRQWSSFPGLPAVDFSIADEADEPGDFVGADEAAAPAEPVESAADVLARKLPMLNAAQRRAYDEILSGAGTCFFLTGPGGCGKSFVYETVSAKLRAEGKSVIACASSGIAAQLLTDGTTAHYRFKIPIKLTAASTCNVPHRSRAAAELLAAHAIFWDEAPMTHRHGFEAVDRMLRDLTKVNAPFGGKLFVCGGDFRQIPPVVRRGSVQAAAAALLNRSQLWSSFKVLHLTHNERLGAANDATRDYAKYLLRVGQGVEGTAHQDALHTSIVTVPQAMRCDGIDPLLDRVFPDFTARATDLAYVAGRAVLTTTNAAADKVNEILAARLQSDSRTYLSADSADDEEGGTPWVPSEFLNGITVNGLPPHSLTLKVGMIIMLIRNLRPDLANGTRLRVERLHAHVIECTVASGRHVGRRHFIHRINLKPADTNLPFTLRRRQFPVKVCYAMTVNKAQGQSLDHVGLYVEPLAQPFSHGQLYVALSRVTNPTNIHIFAPDHKLNNVVVKSSLLAEPPH
jgi:hypothetical protein